MPAFSYEFWRNDFPDPPSVRYYLRCVGFYDENGDGSDHVVKVRIWNYNVGIWENVTTNVTDMPPATTKQHYEWALPLPWGNYNNAGKVRILFIHTTVPGVYDHRLLIDLLEIVDGIESSSSSTPAKSSTSSSTTSSTSSESTYSGSSSSESTKSTSSESTKSVSSVSKSTESTESIVSLSTSSESTASTSSESSGSTESRTSVSTSSESTYSPSSFSSLSSQSRTSGSTSSESLQTRTSATSASTNSTSSSSDQSTSSTSSESTATSSTSSVSSASSTSTISSGSSLSSSSSSSRSSSSTSPTSISSLSSLSTSSSSSESSSSQTEAICAYNTQTAIINMLANRLTSNTVAEACGLTLAQLSSRVFHGLAVSFKGRSKGRKPFLCYRVLSQNFTPLTPDSGTVISTVQIRCSASDYTELGPIQKRAFRILTACRDVVRSQADDTYTFLGDDLIEGPNMLVEGSDNQSLTMTIEHTYCREDYEVHGLVTRSESSSSSSFDSSSGGFDEWCEAEYIFHRAALACSTYRVGAAGCITSNWHKHVFGGIMNDLKGNRNRGRMPFIEIQVEPQNWSPDTPTGGTLSSILRLRCHVANRDSGEAETTSYAILTEAIRTIRDIPDDTYWFIGTDEIQEQTRHTSGHFYQDAVIEVEHTFERRNPTIDGSSSSTSSSS